MTDDAFAEKDPFGETPGSGDDPAAEEEPETGDLGEETADDVSFGDASEDAADAGDDDGDDDGGDDAVDEPALEPLPPDPPSGTPHLAGDFPENWSLLWCCTAIFIATMWLPIEAKVLDLFARDSVAGGFLAVFAGYGIIAAFLNLKYRKMVVWPMLMVAIDGLYVAAKRIFVLVKQIPDGGLTKDEYLHLAGSGLWIILVCSLLILWTFVRSAMSGRKRDQERKEAEQAARKSRRR